MICDATGFELMRLCSAGSTVSPQLAEQAAEFPPIKHFEDLIPKFYQEFRDVFSKESPFINFPLKSDGTMLLSLPLAHSPAVQRSTLFLS